MPRGKRKLIAQSAGARGRVNSGHEEFQSAIIPPPRSLFILFSSSRLSSRCRCRGRVSHLPFASAIARFFSLSLSLVCSSSCRLQMASLFLNNSRYRVRRIYCPAWAACASRTGRSTLVRPRGHFFLFLSLSLSFLAIRAQVYRRVFISTSWQRGEENPARTSSAPRHHGR